MMRESYSLEDISKYKKVKTVLMEGENNQLGYCKRIEVDQATWVVTTGVATVFLQKSQI